MFTAGTVKAADLQNRFCDRFSGLPLRSRNPCHQTCVLRPPLTGAALFCFPGIKALLTAPAGAWGLAFPALCPELGRHGLCPCRPGRRPGGVWEGDVAKALCI